MPLTLAVLYALFLWWFSTGAIIWAVSQRGHRWTVALTAPLAVLALVVLGRSGGDESVAGAFVGFTSAIALWGWLELAFLAGVITGPNRAPCPPGARGWRRFRAAWSAVSHHELALRRRPWPSSRSVMGTPTRPGSGLSWCCSGRASAPS